MSRAFVKEDAGGDGQAVPDRPQSADPALITPRGFEELKHRYEALQAERAAIVAAGPDASGSLPSIDRDLRYLHARIERSVVIREPGDVNRVGFGATVVVEHEDGTRQTVSLVGEDEAEPRAGRVSWTSPLGRALLGMRVGETSSWLKPSGEVQLKIITLEFQPLVTTLR